MLVANSFDLWRKDAFFSAAEEVQESADIMESAYRAWLRERRERSNPEELNELCRELQTALGTAKWQLEELEKAIRLSYRHLGDDNRATRHRQFISAIESQISQVEADLRESNIEEGKQPLRWVNLDEEERDDFAAFLSGTCETVQSTKDECVDVSPLMKSSIREKQVSKEDENVNVNVNAFYRWDGSTNEKASVDAVAVNKDRDYAIEIKADADSRNSDDVVYQTDTTTSTRKTWSPPPNYAALRIVIADEDEQGNQLTRTVDATPKEKGSKPLFWKQKFEEYPQAMRAVHMFNQVFGRIGLCQRQLRSPLHLRHGRSLKVTLALMMIIFLLGKLSVSFS
ncbi:syntaxin/T-SNARE family protein [Medicago truncatula]|uniref:Syntaxin/t-SNARE family protein n=1 Tax=Medicago truncatula TaxID=3880 RepID=G7JVG6_MEDTR|nr:syntaxin/T-SNARE family protein [Medicago truncatula]